MAYCALAAAKRSTARVAEETLAVVINHDLVASSRCHRVYQLVEVRDKKSKQSFDESYRVEESGGWMREEGLQRRRG